MLAASRQQTKLMHRAVTHNLTELECSFYQSLVGIIWINRNQLQWFMCETILLPYYQPQTFTVWWCMSWINAVSLISHGKDCEVHFHETLLIITEQIFVVKSDNFKVLETDTSRYGLYKSHCLPVIYIVTDWEFILNHFFLCNYAVPQLKLALLWLLGYVPLL